MIELPVDELVARYEDGETIRELAAAYAVNYETMRRRLVKAKVKLRKSRAGRPRVDHNEMIVLVRLYEEGVPIARICETLGIVDSQVYQRLRQAGVTPNRYRRKA